MLPDYFPQRDGFVQGIVYSNLRGRIDALMDSLYRNGVDPANMYCPVSETVDAELRAISGAGNRPGASLSDELAAYLVDWYYDEDDDMVQFCIDSYRPGRAGGGAPSGSASKSRKSGVSAKPARASTGKGAARRKPARRR